MESSRTFPGHEWSINSSTAPDDKVTDFPDAVVNFERKCLARMAISEPFPERRNIDPADIQSVIKVLTESLCPYLIFYIFIYAATILVFTLTSLLDPSSLNMPVSINLRRLA